MVKLIDFIKEDVTYTKDKAKELIEKYKKDLERYNSNAKLLYGKFSGITMGDILEESGIEEFKRIGEAAEKFYDKISNEYYKIGDIRSQMYDDYDDNQDRESLSLSKQAEEISSKYRDLELGLEVIKEVSEKIIEKLDHMIEYNKLKHLKDLQQGIK